MLSVDAPVGVAVSVASLIVVIVAAIVPSRLPPAVVAVPVALVVLLTGVTGWSAAGDEIRFMAPTIGFLAAMLVVADVCARDGVFDWLGGVLARWSRGSPYRLLRIVFATAAAVTAVLSIDTTIVLFTPTSVVTARRVGARVTPVAHAGNHLANSASTLLPVSNLTNLLAFGATGISFAAFTGLMAGPWVAAIVVEYLVFRVFFARVLALQPRPTTAPPVDAGPAATDRGAPDPATARSAPRRTLILLGLLLIGFVVAEPAGVPLVAVAAVGALIMAVPSYAALRWWAALRTVRVVDVGFLAFVAALGVIILPVREGPIGRAVSQLLPENTGLLALAVTAGIAAIAANLVNNLPATLLLIPMVAHRPALLLAVLLGVDIGPNLTYFGSLANLLWRDVLRRQGVRARSGRYLLLGTLSVPLTLGAAVLALWLGLQITPWS